MVDSLMMKDTQGEQVKRFLHKEYFGSAKALIPCEFWRENYENFRREIFVSIYLNLQVCTHIYKLRYQAIKGKKR